MKTQQTQLILDLESPSEPALNSSQKSQGNKPSEELHSLLQNSPELAKRNKAREWTTKLVYKVFLGYLDSTVDSSNALVLNYHLLNSKDETLGRILYNFGLDSLDRVELIMGFEDEGGFDIPDDMAEAWEKQPFEVFLEWLDSKFEPTNLSHIKG